MFAATDLKTNKLLLMPWGDTLLDTSCAARAALVPVDVSLDGTSARYYFAAPEHLFHNITVKDAETEVTNPFWVVLNTQDTNNSVKLRAQKTVVHLPLNSFTSKDAWMTPPLNQQKKVATDLFARPDEWGRHHCRNLSLRPGG